MSVAERVRCAVAYSRCSGYPEARTTRLRLRGITVVGGDIPNHGLHMSNTTNPDATATISRVESIYRCVHHLQLWLAAAGVTYGRSAREQFVTAHPALFGRAYEVTLRGYEQWRRRHGLPDTAEAFARYTVRRHERWLTAHAPNAHVAPCLVDTAQPCWRISGATSSAVIDVRAAA